MLRIYNHAENASLKNSVGEYKLVDIFKFFFCICIIILHSGGLVFLPRSVSFFIEKVVFRVAVPYFFIASGFFFGTKWIGDKKNYKEITRKYCKRLLKPFIVFSGINIIQQIISNSGKGFGELLVDLLQHIVFYPYGALWYIQASIIGILLLKPFLMKNKIWFAIVIGCFLYIFSLICNSWYFLVENTPIAIVVNIYLRICITGRNGLFVGFLFLALGIKCAELLTKNFNTKKLAILTSVCFVLYLIEIFIVFLFGFGLIKDDGALYASQVFFVPLLFMFTASVKIKTKKDTIVLRNLSTGMYFLHRPILWFIEIFFNVFTKISRNSILENITILLHNGVVVSVLAITISMFICLLVYKKKKEPFYSLLK